MSETKLTAAALRAAKEIGLKTIIRSEDNVIVSYASISQVAHIIDRETNLPQLEADSKKLREPVTCNAGHKSNLPLALWDCPVCAQLLGDELDRLRPKVEELVRMIKKAAEVAASKQDRQEAAAVVLDLVLPHLGDKAREVEAALKGSAQ